MKTIASVALAVAMGAAAVGPAAAAADLTGNWGPGDKSTTYHFTMCGDSGKNVCVDLIALRDHMDTPKNRPYLNTRLVERAKPSGDNVWKGKMSVFGVTGDATITMLNPELLSVNLCAYIVMCKEYKLRPVD
ncbi:hypothetical protein [Devosia sp. CN2-171]|uniref:hypothetical protein n=1 Tax=Devosia sp. CN2-171 TaxID=3400909 RepID=UPI003BF9003B